MADERFGPVTRGPASVCVADRRLRAAGLSSRKGSGLKTRRARRRAIEWRNCALLAVIERRCAVAEERNIFKRGAAAFHEFGVGGLAQLGVGE